MRIAFVGNHLRTAVFCRVADNLLASGHDIFWIATGSHSMRDLLSSYSDVVDVSGVDRIDTEAILAIEKHSVMAVKDIVASDRILSKKSEKFSLGYISNVFSKVHNLIKSNDIQIVFGEATWAHELVIASVCRMLGVRYLVPSTVRYPSERFAFFEGVYQKRLFETSNVADIETGRELFNRFMKGGNKPFYMNKPERSFISALGYHICRYLKGDTKDMTVPSFVNLVKDKLRDRRALPVLPLPERYVYLPLQVQPEASVDVLGFSYADQYEFVKNVAKCLPEGVKLAVKEHPNRKSRLDVCSIPNVVMVGGDSLDIIRGAEAVVSVSGTACYEAGLLGVPAYIFSEMFFCDLPTVSFCNSYEELRLSLKNKPEPDEGCVVSFLADLYANSYEGYCESPAVYADALSKENISNLIYAFEDVIDIYTKKSAST